MSKVVKAIVGVAMIAVGVISGNPYLILQGALTVGSVLLTPSAKQQDRQAAALSLQLGEVPRQAIFGETLVGGSLQDGFNYGGKYGTDWEVLPIALADHRCEGLTGFYVGDVYVPFTGNGFVSGYNNQLRVTWYDGSADQTADAALISQGGWASTDRSAGVAYVVVEYKADAADAKNPVWPGGRPQFKWLVKGARCYDPRKDSTVAGGSGSHRYDDPTTWEWTDNPIVCRYNWVRGIYACDRVGQPEQLLVGRGLSEVEAPPENVAWRANICDELVALAGGGSERRYRASTLVRADEPFISVEEMWAASCAGVITQPEGSVEIEPGYAKSPTFFITDDDLVVGTRVSFSSFRSETDEQWKNTAVPRYTEPTQRYQDHAAPIRRVYADVIADGGPREATLSLPGVFSNTQAQRCAEIARRLWRLVRTGTITLGPRFAGIEEGDWGVWTSARHTGGLPMTVRVEAMGLDEKWQNTLALREIDASVYDWSIADEIAPGSVATPNPVPPAVSAPGSGAWTLVGGAVTGASGAVVPALFVTGAIDDPYATSILVEYRKVVVDTLETGAPALTVDGGFVRAESAADQPWLTWPSVSTSATTIAISPVEAQGVYEVAISYANARGPSDPLILGPVAAGVLSVARACYSVVGYSGDLTITSDASSISIGAFTAVLDDARTLELPAGTMTGLVASTSYGVFWQFSTSSYVAGASPALMQRASSDYVFVRWWLTSDVVGTYPPAPPSDPGDGGWGPRERVSL